MRATEQRASELGETQAQASRQDDKTVKSRRCPIRRGSDPTDKCADCFPIVAPRKCKASIVRFSSLLRVDRLIHHQIAAAALYVPFEAFDRLEKRDEFLVGFSARKMDPT